MKPLPSPVARNTIVLSAFQFAVKALSAVWTFYLARKLGVAVYGLWANILALISIFGVLQGFGAAAIIFKDLNQNREKSVDYFGASLALYLLSSLIAFLSVVALSWLLGYRGDKMGLAAILGFSFLAFAPALACQAVLYGLQDFIGYTLIYAIGVTIYMAIGVLMIEIGYGVKAIAVALSVGYFAASLILYLRTIRKVGTPNFKGIRQLGIRLTQLGIPFVLSAITAELMLRADRILINQYLGETAVGFYHAVFNIVYLPKEIFLIPLTTALGVRLYLAYAQDKIFFQKLFERANVIFLIIVLPIISFSMIFPEYIVSVFYGKNFEQSAKILPVLVWILLPLSLGILWNSIFVVKDSTNKIFIVNLIGAVLNITLNLFLLPKWKLLVSAWVSVATQLAMFLLTVWLLRNENLLGFFKRIPKVAVSCASATLLVSLLSFGAEITHIKFFLLLFIGMASYTIFLVVFGAIQADEAGWLKQQLKNIPLSIKNKLEIFQ